MHHMGWWSYISYDEKRDRPNVSWNLIWRVLGYAKPYRLKITFILATILLSSLLGLLTPLLFRQLIDVALPQKNVSLLDMLALGIILIPVINAVISIIQRYLNSSVGEGVIYELRVAVYAHLQRMSIRFF